MAVGYSTRGGEGCSDTRKQPYITEGGSSPHQSHIGDLQQKWGRASHGGTLNLLEKVSQYLPREGIFFFVTRNCDSKACESFPCFSGQQGRGLCQHPIC